MIARRVFGEGARQRIVRKHINRLRVKFAQTCLGAGIETAQARGYCLVAADIYGRASGAFGEARVLAALGRMCGNVRWKAIAIRRLTRAEEVFAILDDVTGIENTKILRSAIKLGGEDPWLEDC